MNHPENYAYVSLGVHTNENAHVFEGLGATIEAELQKGKHVAYFMEEASMPTPISRLITQLSQKEGFSPSEAFFGVEYYLLNNRKKPTSEELAAIRKEKMGEKRKDFKLAELVMADRLYAMYPNQFSFHVEATEEYDFPKELKSLLAKSFLSAMNGEYEKGFDTFRVAMEKLGTSSRKREELLAKRIETFLSKPNSVAFTRFGETHTGIVRDLRRDGIRVVKAFDESYEGNHLFTHTDLLVRKKRFFPDKEISQLDWHKGFVASILLILDSKAHFLQGVSRQEIVSKLNRMVNTQLASMEDVATLQNDIKTRGFSKAFADFIPATV